MIFILPEKKKQPANWPIIPLRWVFICFDVLTLAVMLGTFLNEFQDASQYVIQGLAALLVLSYVPIHIRFRLRIAPEFYLAGLFILWSFATGMLFAKENDLVLDYVIRITRFVLLVIAIGGLAMVRRNPSWGLLVIICVAIFLCIFTRTSSAYYDVVAGSVRYSKAVGINPNTVGLYLLWGIASIAFLWGTNKSRLLRGIFAATAMLFAFFIVTTASRKSFLGFLFFIALWLLFCYGKKIIQSTAAFILALLVAYGCFYLSVQVVPETTLGEKLEQTRKEGNLGTSRTGMYIEGWSIFLENPIAGVGLGNFIIVSKWEQFSHSDTVEAFCTTGAVGAMLYFAIYLVLWRRIIRIRRRTSDPQIQYQMGVYMAVILTFFAVGIGVVHFVMLNSWFLLALMICHTTALEYSLSAGHARRLRHISRQVLK